MPSKLTCFWLEPTDLVEVSFRRFRSSSDHHCPASRAPYPGHHPVVWGYHSESVVIEAAIKRFRPHDGNETPSDKQKADPRWPKKCACGYEFADTDYWQHSMHTLYMASNDYGLCTLHSAPAGAMYDAHWFDRKGPDGKSIVLKTPEGDWWIDGPANNGPGWTRTGVPPTITCTPSIGIGTPHRLHGWLRNGVLEIDMP